MVDNAIHQTNFTLSSVAKSAEVALPTEDVVLGALGGVLMPYIKPPDPFFPFDEKDDDTEHVNKMKPTALRKEFELKNKQLREVRHVKQSPACPADVSIASGRFSWNAPLADLARIPGDIVYKNNQGQKEASNIIDISLRNLKQCKQEICKIYGTAKVKSIQAELTKGGTVKDREEKERIRDAFFNKIFAMKEEYVMNNKALAALENELAKEKEEHPDAKTVAQKLIEDGAEINSMNDDGFTALMLAARNGHRETVEALMEIPDCHVNQTNQYGANAMHYAAMFAHRDVCVALRKKGRIDRKAKNLAGKTPKELAQDESDDLYEHKKNIWKEQVQKQGKFKLVEGSSYSPSICSSQNVNRIRRQRQTRRFDLQLLRSPCSRQSGSGNVEWHCRPRLKWWGSPRSGSRTSGEFRRLRCEEGRGEGVRLRAVRQDPALKADPMTEKEFMKRWHKVGGGLALSRPHSASQTIKKIP
eukprot:319020-Hanusia_phi.AAC.5